MTYVRTWFTKTLWKLRRKIADFVTGENDWPQIKTAVHKYGSVLNKHTIDNRNQRIRAVHKQLKTTRALYESGGYMHWLNNIEAVTAATQRAYPRAKSSFSQAAQSICQLCEASSQFELKERYYEAFQQMIDERVSPKRKNKAMSVERVILVREAIETLRLKAVESGFRLSDCSSVTAAQRLRHLPLSAELCMP